MSTSGVKSLDALCLIRTRNSSDISCCHFQQKKMKTTGLLSRPKQQSHSNFTLSVHGQLRTHKSPFTPFAAIFLPRSHFSTSLWNNKKTLSWVQKGNFSTLASNSSHQQQPPSKKMAETYGIQTVGKPETLEFRTFVSKTV
jgi:hypothetical protein